MTQPTPVPDGGPARLAHPLAQAGAAAAALAARSQVARHDVAVVLGSGWQPAAEALGRADCEIAMGDLPGFAPPVVPGHAGIVRSVSLAAGGRALVFMGRTHLYEGHGPEAVVHPIRVAAAAGCRLVVLTNAAGSLDPAWPPGTAVLISDHLNLTGATPLRGATFVDLTDLYSARLRAMCRLIDPGLPEGVYAQFRGPQFETPAEVRMAGILGAQLVGMSTALEAIAARAAGLEVLGISMVANPAAGLSSYPLDHRQVLDVGTRSAWRMGGLLAGVLGSA